MDNNMATAVARAELIKAGFRPARRRGVVLLVRRLLWPFVRPFHFHLLDMVLSLQGPNNATREEIAGLINHVAMLRAELAALANRHAWVEESFEAALAREDRQSRLEESRSAGTLFLSHTQGGIFLLMREELISEMATAAGHWDAHILRIARLAARVVGRRPGATTKKTAVDAGAHFGLISVPLARMFDRVFSFEPNELNHRVLLANIALNGVAGRVDARQSGLFSRNAELSLAPEGQQEIAITLDPGGRLKPTTATNLGAYSFIEGGTGLSPARAYSLDSLSLKDVAFLKVDVQGADGEVICGAVETIRRCRPWLVFEWETHLSQSFTVAFDKVGSTLTELGYVIRVLRPHNEKQTDYVAVPGDELGELDRLVDDACAKATA